MKTAALRPVQDVAWVVEMRGVTLVSRLRSLCVSIPYPHAALWGLLADGRFTLDRGRDLMALLMAADERDAKREVVRTLAAWKRAGLLVSG